MIKQFRVQNYKALRDVTLDLTPIHVLIGPNDSGKTSILEAIAALCRSVDQPLAKAFLGKWEGADLIWGKNEHLRVIMNAKFEHPASKELTYTIEFSFSLGGNKVNSKSEILRSMTGEVSMPPIHTTQPTGDTSAVRYYSKSNRIQKHARVMKFGTRDDAAAVIHDSFSGVHYYRFDARLLSLPVAPDSSRRFMMESSGFGLALCLDDILGFDRDLFMRLENRFKGLFPHIKSIKLMPEPAFKAPVDDPCMIPMLGRADGKGLYFEFKTGGQLVSAAQVSDGVLLVLAYLTILHLPQPPRVVLVEEPENGIHPARLKDILGILRNLIEEQTHTQVVLATHSPYVVDLFKPEEVTLCMKEADGSVSVHRLSESEKVREQTKVFTLGEIWTAEGDEALAGREIKQEEINQ